MAKKSECDETPEEDMNVYGVWENLKKNHAMNMSILQRELNLSYRQARALLLNKMENAAMMAYELGIDIQAVYNARRAAEKKLKASGKTYEEIVGGYAMPSMIINGGPYE